MYTPTETPFPFWGAERKSKGGRDPLAIQNSSVVIYSDMVTGVTNVTERVRYNAFYCWLLTLIATRLAKEDIAKIDSPTEQIKLVRRGELLLAYVMHQSFPEATGISGSIFAQGHFDGDSLNLALGADYENKPDIYWQNSYGIFGQYYVGVMSQLRLIYLPDRGHKSYRATDNGIRLADIFRKSFSHDVEDLFWKSIKDGKIEKSKLESMSGLALHSIANEDELDEFQRIFCLPDRQGVEGEYVCHRINTIKLLLDYIDTKGAGVSPRDFVLAFLRQTFEAVLPNFQNAASEQKSWFLYELNELSHAAYEAFHFAVLYLTANEPQPLGYIFNKLEADFKSYAQDDHPEWEIYDIYANLQNCHNSREGLVYEATRLLVALYDAIKPQFDQMVEFGRLNDYASHLGFAPLMMQRLMDGYKGQCDWEFAEHCIYFAINDHLRSSYSKSTIDQGLVHNYMVDDGLIWKLRSPEPIRTSPRLRNVLQYLQDMQWIRVENNHYTLTERGANILNHVRTKTAY